MLLYHICLLPFLPEVTTPLLLAIPSLLLVLVVSLLFVTLTILVLLLLPLVLITRVCDCLRSLLLLPVPLLHSLSNLFLRLFFLAISQILVSLVVTAVLGVFAVQIILLGIPRTLLPVMACAFRVFL